MEIIETKENSRSNKNMKKIVMTICCLLIFSTTSFAEEDQSENIAPQKKEPAFNIMFGISPFLGVLGFEFKDGHHAYGIGFPERISYRYFYKLNEDTKFWGVYAGRFSLSETDTDDTYEYDGVHYSDVERSSIGAGVGYKWQWESGWNVTTSIAIEYFDEEYSDTAITQTATDSGFMPFPGLNVGYKF